MYTKSDMRAAVDAAHRAARGGVILEVPPMPSVDTPSRMYDYTPDVLIMSETTLHAISRESAAGDTVYTKHWILEAHEPPTCFGIKVVFDNSYSFAQVTGAKILK